MLSAIEEEEIAGDAKLSNLDHITGKIVKPKRLEKRVWAAQRRLFGKTYLTWLNIDGLIKDGYIKSGESRSAFDRRIKHLVKLKKKFGLNNKDFHEAALSSVPEKPPTAKQRLTEVVNTQNTIFANKGKTKARKLTIPELRKHMRKDGLLSSWDDTAHLEKKIRQALNAKYKASKSKAQKSPSNFLDDAKKDLHKKFEPKQKPKAKAAPKAHTLDTIIDEVVNTAKSKHGRIGLGIGAGAVGIAAYLNRDK